MYAFYVIFESGNYCGANNNPKSESQYEFLSKSIDNPVKNGIDIGNISNVNDVSNILV